MPFMSVHEIMSLLCGEAMEGTVLKQRGIRCKDKLGLREKCKGQAANAAADQSSKNEGPGFVCAGAEVTGGLHVDKTMVELGNLGAWCKRHIQAGEEGRPRAQCAASRLAQPAAHSPARVLCACSDGEHRGLWLAGVAVALIACPASCAPGTPAAQRSGQRPSRCWRGQKSGRGPQGRASG
jgi:hypothetical protein